MVTLAEKGGGRIKGLDHEKLDRLELSIGQSGQAQPGETITIEVGTTECCYVFEPVNANVNWSIKPLDDSSIDPKTGELSIGPEIAGGTVYTITAEIENGRKILQGIVTIYRPDENPFVGFWHETKEIVCFDSSEKNVVAPLRELVFSADGTFKATFTPFEIYHDYWGYYRYEPDNHTIQFEVTDGNFIPEELDLEGFYEFQDDGNLLLSDLWLGRKEASAELGCGHLFTH